MITFKIPVYVWRVAVVLYSALLAYVSWIPKVLPGSSTPLKENIHNFFHIPAYAVLTFLFWKSFRSLPLPVIAGIVFAYGIFNEIMQMFVPERTASVMDAVRNGIGIGLMMFLIIRWKMIQKKAEIAG